jgi:hypothetical protein
MGRTEIDSTYLEYRTSSIIYHRFGPPKVDLVAVSYVIGHCYPQWAPARRVGGGGL